MLALLPQLGLNLNLPHQPPEAEGADRKEMHRRSYDMRQGYSLSTVNYH